MNRKIWSDEELSFLKNNYEKLGVDKIAKHLNRSKSSVRTKANRLNLFVDKNLIYYAEEDLKSAVKHSFTYKDVLKFFGLSVSGDQYNVIKKYIKQYNIDVSHFNSNHYKNNTYKPIEEYLIENSAIGSSKLKEKLYKVGLKAKQCEKCGLGEIWNGEKISLILDHVNGINNDNRIENLRILCPNCNATLLTHCRGIKGLIKKEPKIKLKQFKERLNRRKVERPSLDVLLTEVKQMGYVKTGKKYNVSDNAIRKWIKSYNNAPVA